MPRRASSAGTVQTETGKSDGMKTTLWLEAEPSLLGVRYLGAATRGICALVLREEQAADLDLALVEAATNIIKHGFSDRLDGRIRLRLDVSEQRVEVELRDNGPAFDPLSAPQDTPWDTDSYASFDALPEGGFGVSLVRALADGCEYQRQDGENVLILWKYLENPG